MRVSLDAFGYGNDFLGMTPKAQCMKEIIGKLDFIKIKRNSLSLKDDVKSIRTRVTDWEKNTCKKHIW